MMSASSGRTARCKDHYRMETTSEAEEPVASFPPINLIQSVDFHAMLSRVSQLDTTLLDNELFNILIKDPTPETSLVIRAALLHLGLQTYNASYGARLQNLVYANLTARKRWLLVFLATVPPYIHQKMRDAMLVNGWPDYPTPPSIIPWRFANGHGPAAAVAALFPAFSPSKARRKRELRRFAWDTLIRIEKLLALSSLVNLLCFLYNGRHPTLLSRLLRLRYTYAQKSVARNVSYDFLNRQLVWEAFTEFLLFVMPILNLQAIRKRLGQLIDRKKWFGPGTDATLNEKARQDGTAEDGTALAGPLKHLSPDVCAICYLKSPATGDALDPVDPTTSTAFLASMSHKDDNVTVPYVTSCCGARYCYYCIASAIVDDFTCLRCGRKVTDVKREVSPS